MSLKDSCLQLLNVSSAPEEQDTWSSVKVTCDSLDLFIWELYLSRQRLVLKDEKARITFSKAHLISAQ